jgi:hypothetical protein
MLALVLSLTLGYGRSIDFLDSSLIDVILKSADNETLRHALKITIIV